VLLGGLPVELGSLLVWLRLFGYSRRVFFTAIFNLLQCPSNSGLANLSLPKLSHLTLGFVSVSFDKGAKLLPIVDLQVSLGFWLRLGFDIPCFGFAPEPQVNRIATDIEQLTRLTFLESIQLALLRRYRKGRLPHVLPEVVAVGFSHRDSKDKGTLLVYVLSSTNTAIYQSSTRPHKRCELCCESCDGCSFDVAL